jgi:TolB-like protein/Flp pilus assembly protein TadD
MSLYNELKRRNVLRVGAAYVVAAWLIIQVVETIFPAFGFGDAAIRVVVIVLAIAFIPSLVLSWVFEITPEGMKREVDVVRDDSTTFVTGKRIDRIIMVLMVLALGYFAFDKFVLDPARDDQIVETAHQEGRSEALVESYGDKSIAVLAFVNMSDDASNEYFSDGISEELLNLLAKIPELRVTSRTSAFSYKGKDLKLTEVARELNVAHILEGSVRKAGNQVRITVQLIEARSDTHLWSETYDRRLDDIFAIQDEIAAEVVAQLRVTLLGAIPTVEETDPKAYALYLQARHLVYQLTPENMARAATLYQQALAISPDYAAAWTGLSIMYTHQADMGLGPNDESYNLAREAAEKALAVNPEYAPGHARLGWITMIYDGDLAAAARHYDRALALAPTDFDILNGAAFLAQCLGHLDVAIALGEYLVTLDPVNPTGYFRLGWIYRFAGRLDDTITSFRTLLTLSPGFISGQYQIGVALLLKGDPQAALEAMEAESSEHYRLRGLVMVYHALDRAVESNDALTRLIEQNPKGAFTIAYVLAYRGEVDSAFAWLDKAVEYNNPSLSFIAADPMFAILHDDPRWLLFMESIGKSPEQLAAIEFEVTLLRLPADASQNSVPNPGVN